jgi:predicted chitinase
MITLEQFSAMIPQNKEAEEWYEAALVLFEEYKINTPLRIAGFMAQCAHESADFTRLEKEKEMRKIMRAILKRLQTTSTKMNSALNEAHSVIPMPAMGGDLGVVALSNLQAATIIKHLESQSESHQKKQQNT